MKLAKTAKDPKSGPADFCNYLWSATGPREGIFAAVAFSEGGLATDNF